MISFIMEEKVVRPPRNPVTRNAEARGEGKCWVKKKARRPIRKEPAPLTRSVP